MKRLVWLVCVPLLFESVAGCETGATVPQACYASTSDQCTTKGTRYNAATEMMEPVERHYGCTSWSGSSCNTWVDADDSSNQTMIEAARGMRDWRRGQTAGAAGASPSAGGSTDPWGRSNAGGASSPWGGTSTGGSAADAWGRSRGGGSSDPWR